MELKIEIKNFKKFQKLSVDLKHKESPFVIIGDNNSGKTSFFEAIECFKRIKIDKDLTHRYLNADLVEEIKSSVILKFSIVEEDLKKIKECLKKFLENLNPNTKLSIKKDLKEGFNFKFIEFVTEKKENLLSRAEQLIEQFPVLKKISEFIKKEYFVNKNPTLANIKTLLKKTGEKTKKYQLLSILEKIKKILERYIPDIIFHSKNIVGSDLEIDETFQKKDDDYGDSFNLEIVNKIIKIVRPDFWQKYKNYNDDSQFLATLANKINNSVDDLFKEKLKEFYDSIDFQFNLEKNCVSGTIQVREKKIPNQSKSISLKAQGSGFKEFFAMIINICYVRKKLEEKKLQNIIFMIDEPGKALAPSLQKKIKDEIFLLYKEFKNIPKIWLLYTTHIPHLINYDSYHEIGQTLILTNQKNNDEIVSEMITYSKHKYENKFSKINKNTLLPLYHSLGYNFLEKMPFYSNKFHLFVEGQVDLICYKFFAKLQKKDISDWIIVPMNGANKEDIPFWLIDAIFFEKKHSYLIIFDLDQKEKKQYLNLKENSPDNVMIPYKELSDEKNKPVNSPDDIFKMKKNQEAKLDFVKQKIKKSEEKNFSLDSFDGKAEENIKAIFTKILKRKNKLQNSSN